MSEDTDSGSAPKFPDIAAELVEVNTVVRKLVAAVGRRDRERMLKLTSGRLAHYIEREMPMSPVNFLPADDRLQIAENTVAATLLMGIDAVSEVTLQAGIALKFTTLSVRLKQDSGGGWRAMAMYPLLTVPELLDHPLR